MRENEDAKQTIQITDISPGIYPSGNEHSGNRAGGYPRGGHRHRHKTGNVPAGDGGYRFRSLRFIGYVDNVGDQTITIFKLLDGAQADSFGRRYGIRISYDF